jgi:hypothetical protein
MQFNGVRDLDMNLKCDLQAMLSATSSEGVGIIVNRKVLKRKNESTMKEKKRREKKRKEEKRREMK